LVPNPIQYKTAVISLEKAKSANT